jgi:hypothetical protein
MAHQRNPSIEAPNATSLEAHFCVFPGGLVLSSGMTPSIIAAACLQSPMTTLQGDQLCKKSAGCPLV